jgi:hypothetical protein
MYELRFKPEFGCASPEDTLVFYAGSVLEEFVVKRWASLPPSDRAALRTTVLTIILHRFDSLAPFARNKAADAAMRMIERAWPDEFPDFLPWLGGLLAAPRSVLCGLHFLECVVSELGAGRGRSRLSTARRAMLKDLVLT